MATDIEKAPEALQELVAEGRHRRAQARRASTAKVIFGVALAWALFQLWYASPLPFTLRLRHPERHRGALAAPRASRCSSRSSPGPRSSARRATACRWSDWVLALAGAFAGRVPAAVLPRARDAPRAARRRWTSSSRRPGSCCCSRRRAARSAGRWPCSRRCSSPTAWSAPYLPEVLRTRARRSTRLLSHMWLTTEGVFGIALGVSTGTIFVYVLFGALLDRAGGGNYMMQVSLRARSATCAAGRPRSPWCRRR